MGNLLIAADAALYVNATHRFSCSAKIAYG